jgi:leader peptidase (prepilin peptidase)/N-methyltransferase
MDLDIGAKDPDMFSIILYAIAGLLVGGLLNALADTLPSKGRIRPPSCQDCLAPRPWLSWLATLGVVLGKRNCAQCGAPIRPRNVVVELSTAVTFGYLMADYGLTGHMLLISIYMAIFILVTVIDIEHRLVLNRVIFPAILLALIVGPFTPGLNWKLMLVGGLVGFGIFYVIAMIYPGGMGAGDVKLAAFIGLITGFPDIFLAVIVAILAGGLISLILVLTRTRSTRDYIPYGPFLVIGGVFTLLWGQPLVDDYVDIEETHGGGTSVAAVLEVDPPWDKAFDPKIIEAPTQSFAVDLGLVHVRE